MSVLFSTFLCFTTCFYADDKEQLPYDTGVFTLDLVDTKRDNRLLRTEVWYPAKPTKTLPQPYYNSSIKSNAKKNAPPADGKFPLILFSHGFTAVREQSAFLTEYWAAHGMIVISCDHLYNSGRDLDLTKLYQTALDRPKDIRFLLQQALRISSNNIRSPIYQRVDSKKIGACGHSLGAYTVLAIGGAYVKTDLLPDNLFDNEKPDYLDFHEPKIQCLMALTPNLKLGFSPYGLSKLKCPTMIWFGSRDSIAPSDESFLKMTRSSPAIQWIGILQGGSHFNFSNEEMIRSTYDIVQSFHKPTIDRELADDLLQRSTLEFWQRMFNDDQQRNENPILETPGEHIKIVVSKLRTNGTQQHKSCLKDQ